MRKYIHEDGTILILDLRFPPLKTIGEVWSAYSYTPDKDKIEYWTVTPDGLREAGFQEMIE